MRIRPAQPADEEFVRDLAGDVFSAYGDYRHLLPEWFRQQGIITFVAETGGQRTGYLMLGFFRDGKSLVGDVLAVAVAPAFQNHGVGRTLLTHAIAHCDAVALNSPMRALRLSVAHTNAPARHLFESCGFVELAGHHGNYAGGQRAIHMERPVSPP